MHRSASGQVDELWEHRHDPEEWGEEAVEVQSQPSGFVVFSLRLPYDEFERLDELASAKGVSLCEYIREGVSEKLWQTTKP